MFKFSVCNGSERGHLARLCGQDARAPKRGIRNFNPFSRLIVPLLVKTGLVKTDLSGANKPLIGPIPPLIGMLLIK